MKKIILFILLSNFLSSNAQTEKETINFLNSMFDSYCTPMSMNETATFNLTTQIESRSNKKILIFDQILNGKSFATYKIHPEHVSSIFSDLNRGKYTYIEIISNEGLILRKWTGESEETFQKEIRIPLTNSTDEVVRIKKALTHLLKINGKKIPDDNLFKN
ncbi:MAG: hypothetical protein ABI554_09670 [Flavobacterium sp.]